MKVRALISFVGYDQNRTKYRVQEGQEFDLPAGVDWLKAGLVEEIKAKAKELPSPQPKARGGKARQEELL
jgi:hypothetical protein